MKKIAIFGSYNGVSIGDTAILVGLLKSLPLEVANEYGVKLIVPRLFDLERDLSAFKIEFPVEIVTLETERGGFFRRCLRAASRAILPKEYFDFREQKILNNALTGCSFLLIGGGNLLMDLYPAWPKILLQVCTAANNAQIPYSFIGVGAGPIDTPEARSVLGACLQGAAGVYFRDESSKALCESVLDFKTGSLIPDLALGLPSIEGCLQVKRRNLALVNLAAIWGKAWPSPDESLFSEYISNMVGLVGNTCRRMEIKQIHVFETNSSDSEASSAFVTEFVQRFRDEFSIEFPQERRTVSELLDVARTAKIGFITRLHAGILAAKSGCEIVAVCYQPKVADVLVSIGVNPCVIDLNKLALGNYNLKSQAPNDLSGFKREIYDCLQTVIGA